MKTAVVSIGRNLGSVPMVTSDWDSFRADLLAEIVRQRFPVFFRGNGVGNSGNGMRFEESFTAVFAWEDSETSRHFRFHALPMLAKKYGQDAIALTIGRTSFVGPEYHAEQKVAK